MAEDKPNVPLNLSKRPRPHENLIQLFLLACGLLSIVTTVGIIWVLLQEALGFFTRELWENSNRSIVEAIDTEQTSFRTNRDGRPLHTGQTIRLGGETGEVLLLERYETNDILISITGTGAGFISFCAGASDIASASRPIEAEELATCQANGIEPLAFTIANDALVVVVNSTNTMVQEATLEELALIFGSTAANWSDIRPEWPNEPIMRFIPGTDSGTFDFFVDEIYGGDESALTGVDASRVTSRELITSEDDKQLARGVSQNPYAVSFFAYAYYQANQESLKALNINSIAPSPEADYPLNRPLLLYTNAQALAKPQVAAFLQFTLENTPDMLANLGYFPLSQENTSANRQLLLETSGQAAALLNGDSFFAPIAIENLEGNILIAGSSTLAPLLQAVQADFYAAGFQPIAHVLRGYNETQAQEHSSGNIETGSQVSLVEFFTGTVWQPAIGEFGILPLIYGTVSTSLIAIVVALPMGMGAAIYLSEYAPENVRKSVKPILEILAGIPTVVYGYFALSFMTPFLQSIFGDSSVQIYNSASPGIVIGILLVPLISSMSEDALSAVPRGLREASYGLGATKLETTMKVVIPAALSGILAAFIIAISRAIGETMIVAIAAGSGPQNNIPNLLGLRGAGIILEPAETMTGHIARISGGDLSYASIDYSSIFAIGLMLFILTFALNLINNAIVRRFREAY